MEKKNLIMCYYLSYFNLVLPHFSFCFTPLLALAECDTLSSSEQRETSRKCDTRHQQPSKIIITMIRIQNWVWETTQRGRVKEKKKTKYDKFVSHSFALIRCSTFYLCFVFGFWMSTRCGWRRCVVDDKASEILILCARATKIVCKKSRFGKHFLFQCTALRAQRLIKSMQETIAMPEYNGCSTAEDKTRNGVE